MRRETVQLVRQAVSEGCHAYVLVNNRSEGNAPLTVQELSEMLCGEVIVSIAQGTIYLLCPTEIVDRPPEFRKPH